MTGSLAVRLRRMAAQRALARTRAAFADSGAGLIERLVGNGAPTLWQRYPPDGLCDPLSGAHAYFHIHPPEDSPDGEFGHFHVFLHPEAMTRPPRPLVDAPPTAAAQDEGAGPSCHLVAIGVDFQSRPLRVFATNQWVTGDAWYAGEDMIGLIDRFTLEPGDGDPLIGRWLTAVLHLLGDVVIEVIRARDRRLAAANGAPLRPESLADRGLEILAECPVDPRQLDDP